MGFFGGGASGIGGSTGATDNAILRADGTGGVTLQNSALNIDDPVSPFSITGVASTDIITAVGHNFTTNQGVIFPTLTGGAGLTAATTIYFVRDISGDTFKVSTTSGGAAVNFTTDITAGTVIAIQANVAITNKHSETNSALVLTPKGTGAFIVGPKPDGTATGGNARGANAICIQTNRALATAVASGSNSIALGNGVRSTASQSVAIGQESLVSGGNAVGIGKGTSATQAATVAIGDSASASSDTAVAIGQNVSASLRSQFNTIPFSSVYWNGSTTNNTETILSLDNAAIRFTIAANTAIMADLFIIARRTDTVDKWFSSRRMVAIRRNNANGTAIIGSVQTIGVDQAEGSPTWSVAITADDTNEALQVAVTGATGETIQWRVLALYRVV